MKIQLEQKSSNCPDHMNCVACAQKFKVGSMRRLLIDDRSMIQGDLCHSCARRTAPSLQQLLRSKGQRLLSKHPERGQEMMNMAIESVQFPSLWQWLTKKIEILSAETTALEQARFNINTCNCRQIQKLEYIYQEIEKH